MLSAPESSYILDRNGDFLYEVHGDIKRTNIPLNQIPQHLKDATVAVEDKNFYKHFGFEPLAIIRATIINIRYGEIRQGASTITQQLARTVLLNNEVTYSRKIKEIISAIKIESLFTKDEILEMYLNNIPYGSNAYGVAAASEIYFNKKVQDLSLMESAYLAALPKAPSDYSPFGPDVDRLHARARLVIKTMLNEKYLTNEQAQLTLDEDKLEFKYIPTPIRAPHFVFYIIDYISKIYGEEKLRNGGLTIYTSLDLDLQNKAEEIITNRGNTNEKKFNAGNAALVAINPQTGEILSMVGSRDYFSANDGTVNVTTSLRQPGSSFKPYVYAAGLENGLNPASMLFDIRTDFASNNNGVSYIPRNYSGRYNGPVSVRQALAGSLNIPAVKVLVLTGLEKSIETAEKFGISSLKDRSRFGPSIVLGGAEVTLLEHTSGLGAFGNEGIKKETNPILKILGKNKKIIYQSPEGNGTQAIDPQVAYLINDILSDNTARQFIFGKNSSLNISGHQVAAKTGTTQDFRDAWTVGYTPSLSVGVWSGNNDNTPMKDGANGLAVAAPIWKEFMENALADKPDEKFNRPEEITELTVDKVSGKLPSKYSLSTKKEIFASFNSPSEKDDIHVPLQIEGIDAVVTNFHSENPNDPLWEQAVKQWSLSRGYSPLENISNVNEINITDIILPITFSVPDNIQEPNWELHLTTQLGEKISLIKIFMDKQLLTTSPSDSLHYANDGKILSPGTHNFTAHITTNKGDIFTINRTVQSPATSSISSISKF
ncbi:MAG: PBP1A family penicillin-binding protein [Patescibacteria group bacterium]|nr:PBP1A family penicillin-binding protein [Patescibacteria group bacterium]